MAATVALMLAVLATQYPEGGGLEWAGRFFSPVAAPLAVLAAVAMFALVGTRDGRWRPVLIGGLAALVGVPAVAGLAVLHTRHVTVATIEQEALGRHPAVVVTSSDSLPRNLWRSHREVVWYLVPPDEVGEALHRLRAAGTPEVELIEPPLPAATFATDAL